MDLEKTKKRREYTKEWRKKQRIKLRKEHRCIWCKKKVKPVITYPYLCDKHNVTKRKLRRLKHEKP